MAFLPNPEKKRCVNHMNGIRTDNRVENLEWATDYENQRHSIEVLGRSNSFPRPAITGEKNYRSIPVRVLKDGEEVGRFGSCNLAAKHIGGIQGNIWKCLNGDRPSHRGFTFERINKEDFIKQKNGQQDRQ
jgi:hypothetical protein